MAFDGTEGAIITLKEAEKFTADYRAEITKGTVISHYFGKVVLEKILAQQDCVGIRMYHGKDENGNKNLVLVGVTENEDDMTQGLIADRSVICPPFGGGSLNSLNS